MTPATSIPHSTGGNQNLTSSCFAFAYLLFAWLNSLDSKFHSSKNSVGHPFSSKYPAHSRCSASLCLRWCCQVTEPRCPGGSWCSPYCPPISWASKPCFLICKMEVIIGNRTPHSPPKWCAKIWNGVDWYSWYGEWEKTRQWNSVSGWSVKDTEHRHSRPRLCVQAAWFPTWILPFLVVRRWVNYTLCASVS